MPTKKAFAVLCSGGDGPGMNSAIRSVVRTALSRDMNAYGILHGYQGLLDRESIPMDLSSVGNIIQRGGTVLHSSRCPDFRHKEYRQKAYEYLKELGCSGLIVIGGNGSYNGAHAFHEETNFPVACIPGTIDNDIAGTAYSIGFDTALNTAVSAIDKIRDTATSHERTFMVEVMGRSSGMIAITVAIATGAESVIFPDLNVDLEGVAQTIKRGRERGKKSSIIIVAEGEKEGLGHGYQNQLLNKHGIDSKLCILGHIQRGGTPTPRDRFLGAKMGNMAVNCLVEGGTSHAMVVEGGKFKTTTLGECLSKRNDFDEDLLNLLNTLAL